MKVVALVSGGKDSCYNMVQCVMAGHQVVALANLTPLDKDELDSYMYQTVGHQGVELYSEALGLPLFRQETKGVALHSDKLYTPTPQDEVEDLYQLLSHVKSQIDFEAVSVGAVMSDYQRLRVENVCCRLGVVSLAYMWMRDQAALLQEMVDYGIKAVIIKVAALGLDPTKHLGLPISQIQPHLVAMNKKYGLHICGEGGEYETFTLDCPLFKKAILIEDFETVIQSNDNIAPVGYLNFRTLSLKDKEEEVPDLLIDRLKDFPIKTALDYVLDIDEEEEEDTPEIEQERTYTEIEMESEDWLEPEGEGVVSRSEEWCWVSGVVGRHPDPATATLLAISALNKRLKDEGLSLKDVVRVCMFVRDLSCYQEINAAYCRGFTADHPPVRVCVGAGLPPTAPVLLQATATSLPMSVLHVQSISHWAPANIGPYSHAIMVGDIVYVAGQIGLVPGSMTLVSGGARRQCRLALRHISRLLAAALKDITLTHIVQGICYVSDCRDINILRKEWEKKTNNAIVEYVEVTSLPRGAAVEWQLWAHKDNHAFHYEETGCILGSVKVSLRRRYNYDRTVCAVVSEFSTVGDGSVEEADCVAGVKYTMERLMCGEGVQPAHLQLYYRGRDALRLATLALCHTCLLATTTIPVTHLSRPSTFLSICAVAHSTLRSTSVPPE